MEDLRVLLFLHLIEPGIMSYCSLSLLGLRIPFKLLAVVSAGGGLAVYLLRGLYAYTGIPFGSHTLLMILVMVLLYRFVAKIEWGIGTVAALLGFILVQLSEACLAVPLVSLFKLTVDEILVNPWLHIAFGWLVDLPVVILALVCALTGFRLVDLNRELKELPGVEEEKE
ncbi:MAG: hypothetical protein QHH75_03410 [Bacillota bacterium]|nr:hypothetical protein [Bacillota bacterium]